MEEVKKSKKKNKVASLLLALALILTCGVAGTIAQYQKSLGGTSEATVAKFKVSAGKLNGTQNANIQLFDTVYEASDGTTTEDHVAKNRIAPGTCGKIDLTLNNESEVDVECLLTVALSGGEIKNYYDSTTSGYKDGKIPLKFALSTDSDIKNVDKNNEWVDMDNLSSLKNASYTSADSNAIAKNTQKALYLYWKWDFGSASTTPQNDLDTAIGEIMQFKGLDADGATSSNPNTAVAPNTDTPSSLKAGATFTLPEVKVTAKFTQVN